VEAASEIRMKRKRKPPPWNEYAAGSEIGHFAKFCREHLIQSEDRWEGKPLVLEPWQRRMLGDALAFDSDGWPSWRSVVIVAPRKNGKTATLAALSLYRLLTSAGRPEILLAAPSDRVAGRLFDAAARFVRRSSELSRLVRVREPAGELVREDGMGIVYRLSSDPARLYGFNPTHVVVDELAWWTTPNLRRAYAALTSGGGARSAPQVFTITTAGEAAFRHDSILGKILDAGLDSDDVERTPGLSISRLQDAGTLVWAYEAPTIDPHDVDSMKLANPASWVTKAYLRRQALDPELTDAQVLQLHGCVWAAGETTFIPPDAWAARVDRSRVLEPDERVALGFDGSYRRDATALVAATLDGFVTPIAVWERPEHAPAEWKVPRDEVDDAIADAMERFDVLELAADPPGWNAELDGWRETYGDVVIDYPTNERRRMTAACDRFRVGVLEGDLSHDGNTVLARHLGHCVAKDTPYGQLVTKDAPDSPRKIDCAVAAIVAYDRAMWHAANTPEREPLIAFT
jgi:phage terminase large subunit-like protein